MNLVYSTNTSGEEQILHHLKRCSDNFIPPLKSKVTINEYAYKIFKKATRFEAWQSEELIGLIAAYFNSSEQFAFITNVSVIKKCSGLGIGSQLLNNSIAQAKEAAVKKIILEVNEFNTPALKFYGRFGFEISSKTNDSLFLQLLL